jgi:hypothetical protein
MFYTVYKITNLSNGKVYIGVHKTTDLDDSYMGSGKMLKRAIAKHGLENFKKEYLAIFDNANDMFKMESELVNEEFVKSSSSYNIKEGGHGGFDHLNSGPAFVSRTSLPKLQTWIFAGNVALREKLINDASFKTEFSRRVKAGLKKRGKIESPGFTGKRHSDSTKEKISKANSVSAKGKSNSQFGTKWICNPTTKANLKLRNDETLPDGYILGRNKFS